MFIPTHLNSKKHSLNGWHISFKLQPQLYPYLEKEHMYKFIELCSSLVDKHFKRLTEVHYPFPYGGFSGAYVLAESHLTYHTYPECGCVVFDIYYCSESVNPEDVIKDFKKKFNGFILDQKIEPRF